MPLFGNIFDFSKENKQKEDDKKWFLQPKVTPPFIYCFTFMNKAGQQYHKGNNTWSTIIWLKKNPSVLIADYIYSTNLVNYEFRLCRPSYM